MKPTLLQTAARLNKRTDYWQKVLHTAPANIIEYWPMREGSGTAIEGIKNGRDGTYTGVTWGKGLLGEEKAPIVVDSGDLFNVFSAGFASGWGTGAEGTVLLWACSTVPGRGLDTWIDGSGTHDSGIALSLYGGNAYIYYSYDGIDMFQATVAQTTKNWVHFGISWTTAGNAQTAYVGGSAVATAAFKGAFVPTRAGGDGASYENSRAKLAHLAVWNTCLSAAQIAHLARV